MIAGSVQTAAKEKISLLAPYDEWYFNFFYPNSLPAQVTYVELPMASIISSERWPVPMPVQEVLDNGARKYQGCRQFLIKPKIPLCLSISAGIQ
mgnify:CR=1 FL=1